MGHSTPRLRMDVSPCPTRFLPCALPPAWQRPAQGARGDPLPDQPESGCGGEGRREVCFALASQQACEHAANGFVVAAE